jgi:chromosome segregation ATPase
MRVFLCAFIAVTLAVSCAALPPGFNSASELATVLANEPDAAREVRFAQVQGPIADSITFKDDSDSGYKSSVLSARREADEADADVSDIDAQVDQINADLKKLKEAIAESEECARRLTEQQAEVRSLQEQKQHLEKEKEKRILQTKLDKQMKDLAEINRMSRSLRTKFAELKHTQKLIKTKMTGTRSSLSQLDADTEPISNTDVSENAADIEKEIDSMQKAQAELLARTHAKNSRNVKQSLKNTHDIHKRGFESSEFDV